MSSFAGPYTLASIADAVQSMRLPLIRRLITRPNPTHFALSFRRVKRSTSVIIAHEGIELMTEVLENAPSHTLDYVYEYGLAIIAFWYTIHLIYRIVKLQQIK